MDMDINSDGDGNRDLSQLLEEEEDLDVFLLDAVVMAGPSPNKQEQVSIAKKGSIGELTPAPTSCRTEGMQILTSAQDDCSMNSAEFFILPLKRI